ncbi:carcinine hydrolase/isopenicillin-N N-acyltransferase family protein [Desulfatirhabdium butyrativorans]|uniref:carcinine hydrolase/isopenicillin-N N-acyltransferase family protein n=1 Tax=Desulfatirhabdium butyrativorans TaxID=340467 RepID=UPI0003F7C36A|nr:carcinine hydrolase/isopenicillin-N N-acyltransferase family protein [Desulfatirhabdium butyrativorans]
MRPCHKTPAHRLLIIWWLMLVVCCIGTGSVDACTLWGAAGTVVSGGGTLICKNRDWTPNQRQVLEMVIPESGYRYFALRVVHPKGNKTRAAINEKGLVVTSASAGSIPASKRRQLEGHHRLSERIMEQCASVDEVLQHSDWFKAPTFLMLADQHCVAIVEIGPRGVFSVRKTTEGVLFHTNHYLDPKMRPCNERIGESSAARLARIRTLLDQKKAGYTMEDFISMSKDSVAGPDNSIWRTGSRPTKTRTLATWIVEEPMHGDIRLFVRIANPGETEREYRMDFTSLFTKGENRNQ